MAPAPIMLVPQFPDLKFAAPPNDDYRIIGRCLLPGVRVLVRTQFGEEWGVVAQSFAWSDPLLTVVTDAQLDERVAQQDILAVDLDSITDRAFRLVASYIADVVFGHHWWANGGGVELLSVRLSEKWKGAWTFGGTSLCVAGHAHPNRFTRDGISGLESAVTDREALAAIAAHYVHPPQVMRMIMVLE